MTTQIVVKHVHQVKASEPLDAFLVKVINLSKGISARTVASTALSVMQAPINAKAAFLTRP